MTNTPTTPTELVAVGTPSDYLPLAMIWALRGDLGGPARDRARRDIEGRILALTDELAVLRSVVAS